MPEPSGRVVVTGLGAVTPIGIGVAEFWEGICTGRSGAGPVTHIDATLYSTRIAAEVKGFNAEDWVEPKEARRMDRFLPFAVAASKMAIDDAAIEFTPEIAEEFGVLIGSGIGGLTIMAEQYRKQLETSPSRVSPFWVPYMIPDMASGFVSIVHGLKGPNTCVVTACATSANAIGDAYHIIKRGDAVGMIAGGTEAPIGEIGLAAFAAARAMTTRNDDPDHASRPFDKERDGFLIGEGAGTLVLEDYNFAKARGAKMYGEIVGYGMSGDAYHITQPAPNHEGAARSMKKALKSASLEPAQIEYVNAHGTSTPMNDRNEVKAYQSIFSTGIENLPISSTKSMTGHLLGAAGAIEAIACLLAMRDGILPPTINYDFPDPECDIDCVPNMARKQSVAYSMSNSFGFGGHNATLIFKRDVE